jgi:hypothetical protein
VQVAAADVRAACSVPVAAADVRATCKWWLRMGSVQEAVAKEQQCAGGSCN